MKKLGVLAIVIFCFYLTITHVSASYGVSPADITFDYLAPGMTVEKEFLVSKTDLTKETKVVAETDIVSADSWVSFEPGVSFIIPKGQQSKSMKVLISVPADAGYKKYNGYINLKFTDGGANPGVSVVGGVGIAVNLNVTKLEIEKLIIRRIDIPETQEGNPINIVLGAENQGNQATRPDVVNVRINDTRGKELMVKEIKELEEVNPGEKKEITARINNSLDSGEYQAEISVLFLGKVISAEKIIFNINNFPANKEESISSNNDIKRGTISPVQIIFLPIIPVIFIWGLVRRKIYGVEV